MTVNNTMVQIYSKLNYNKINGKKIYKSNMREYQKYL